MNCPDQGRILLYLEGELSLEENRLMERHLVSCSYCLQLLNEVEDHLNFALETRGEMFKQSQQTELAGQSEVWKQVQKNRNNGKWGLITMKFKKAAIAAAIVLAIGFVGTIPAVQTATANFLQVFRVQEIDTVTLGPNDLMHIENALQQGNQQLDLEKFGTIATVGEAEERSLTAEELSSLAFKAKLPALMDGQDAEYRLQKIPAIEIKPQVENVNKFLLALGSEYELPQALDGQICRITMGESLITRYNDFTFYQGPAPQMEVPDGVKVKEVARAMVALPIWPENVKRQLESVNDWEHTLLIPTGENASEVKVNGKNAVLMNENHSRMLIWQDNDMLYFIEAHSDKQLDLVKIAESLR